jgi:hypothetical protein
MDNAIREPSILNPVGNPALVQAKSLNMTSVLPEPFDETIK